MRLDFLVMFFIDWIVKVPGLLLVLGADDYSAQTCPGLLQLA
jgi:hypothetical protein